MDRIHAPAQDGEGTMWENDGVEVFVLPGGANRFFQAMANAAGRRANFVRELDTDFLQIAACEGPRAAAVQGDDYWSVEVAISFEAIGARPKDGTRWRGNFGRNVTAGGWNI